MRWWLNTDHKSFSVDNAAVNGMDFSSLDPGIWMVQWTEGKGEIERQIDPDTNDNGIRETFIDVVPYAPFFQQFLSRCPLLKLPQAQKIQIDLIIQIFETKRQAPFHYPVAAGDYWWNATDEVMGASTNAALQNTISKVNEVVSRVNALVNSLLNAQLVAEINSKVAAGVNNTISAYNNGVVNVGNNLRASINTSVVTPTNAGFNDLNTYTTLIGNQLIAYINNTILGTYGGGGANTLNNKVHFLNLVDPPTLVAGPGLDTDIAHIPFGFSSNANRCASLGESFAGASGISGVNSLPWTNIANVTASNQQWIPIGATAPVNVTPTEQAAIMAGIAARTNDLNVKKNKKIGEVNALTKIQDVIDYDVTTGW